MAKTPAKSIRVNSADPRVTAALDAERALFDHYDLSYQVHPVGMPEYGIRLRVLEVGSGQTVLFVPGGSGEAIQFVPMLAAMSGYRAIVVNRPGGGMSDAIDHRGVDLRCLGIDSLTAVLDAFGLEQAPIVASSMGSLWTLWLAQDHPQRVSEMVHFGCPAVLLGTSAPLPMRLLSVAPLNRLLFRLTRPDSAARVRNMLAMLGCSEDMCRSLPEPFVEALIRMFALPTYRLAWLSLLETVLNLRGARPANVLGPADLECFEQPTRFIWGDNDVFGGVEVGHRAARLMRDADIQIISGSHVPFVDKPEECARLTGDFLSQQHRPALSLAPDKRQAS